MGTDRVLENVVWRKLGALLVLFLVVPEMLAVLSAVTQPACAYVDPGSGLLAFQILSTTFAGVVFLIRKRLRRVFLITHTIPKNEALNKK